MTGESTNPEPPCRFAEIVQYTCDAGRDAYGRPQYHCFPIPRIFKLCRGHPALEITKLVDIDSATGEVVIPKDASDEMLPVKATWKSVTRYKSDDGPKKTEQ